MTNADTRNREVTALLKLNAYKPLKRLLVITYSEEDTFEKDGLTVEIVPVWKWLLDE